MPKISSILIGSESQRAIGFIPNGLKKNLYLLYFSDFTKVKRKSKVIIHYVGEEKLSLPSYIKSLGLQINLTKDRLTGKEAYTF